MMKINGFSLALTTTTTTMLGLIILLSSQYVHASISPTPENQSEDFNMIQCVANDYIGNCLKKRVAREIDQIETRVMGDKRTSPSMSDVIERSGDIIANGIYAIQNYQQYTGRDFNARQQRGFDESRKIKGHKKEIFKHFKEVFDLVKSKTNLVLDIFGTGLQIKFFTMGLIGLIINILQFWLNFRKEFAPSAKSPPPPPPPPMYYSYDESRNQWSGRSNSGGSSADGINNESVHNLAYKAYASQR